MSGRRLSLACLLLLGSALAGPAEAADERELLARALEQYAHALDLADRDQRLEAFHRAEMLFARAATEGAATPELYANIGNAALQAERLGPAVLAYRRALRADPDHARALQNLNVDIIEAGFAAASPGDAASVRAIAQEIEGPTICSLARLTPYSFW